MNLSPTPILEPAARCRSAASLLEERDRIEAEGGTVSPFYDVRVQAPSERPHFLGFIDPDYFGWANRPKDMNTLSGAIFNGDIEKGRQPGFFGWVAENLW